MKALRSVVLAVSAALAQPACAQVSVSDAWVRATVPAQKTSGAYMKLMSREDAKVVSASSPAAKATEIHEMVMKGGVMEMRELSALALPAGKLVELKPGGYHLMLLELAKPLAKGETVPIELTVENRAGKRTKLEVKAAVRR